MVEACSHPDVVDGRCTRCGACTHEVVLNGACYFCGATDIQVTVRPAARTIVPVTRLRRGTDGGSGSTS
jgi:hypothetical protein